jgi:type III pantothenate kinase
MAIMYEGTAPANLMAVDIGNSRIKIGRFRREPKPSNSRLPEPIETLDLSIRNDTGEFATEQLAAWCDAHRSIEAIWRVASVHRAAAVQFTSAVSNFASQRGCGWQIHLLTNRDLPLVVRVDQPERVGIDRLLAAFSANRLRRADRAAIVVDLGTAITVDLVEADGAFAGGAILPGIATAARALEEQTDALPRVPLEILDKPPDALGKSTVPAIESGIYWGTIGAIRELIAQLSNPLPMPPDIFITGGASARVAELWNGEHAIRHMPHLVLSGIALVHQS